MATSFDLVVGINESATLDNFKRQLSGIIEQVEGELPKLKLGFDSSSLDKDFKGQLTGLLAGIQSAATSAIAPLQEIQNLVGEISKKDFNLNFNYSDAQSGAERVGEYVQRVKAYISDLGEATKEIQRLSGLTPGQVAGKAIDANQLENYKRFLEILESVEKMSARLDKVGTISGAKGIAKEAEQMWSELIPWIERAKELGIMDQNTKFALFPEVPESAANTMMSLADIIKNMLQPMQDMQREADGIVASEEKVAGSAESTTQKIEEQAAAYQKAAETMRGGGSSISGGVGGIGDDGAEKLRDELKIVDEYYARMKDLVKYREDITLTGDGYTSQSGYYSAFVNQLNSAKSAYDGLVASLHANVDAENASRLSLEDKDKVLTRIIEKQQELDRVTAAAEGKDAVRRAKDDISSTQQSIRALEEMERQERAVAEAAQSVVTPMQEQVNALTGVDNAAKSAADSANAMQMAWAMQKEEVKAQAEADKILAEEERAVAEAAQSVVTPMQEQVNALTGVDNAAKSAADSASAMQMAWAMQKEEAQEVAAAIKAVDDYYKEMSSVIGNKDISFDGEKWVASNEAMQEQADRLNTLKTEMEQYTVATNESTATSAQQEAATKRQAAAQKEYEDTLRNTATSALSSYSSAMKQSEQDLRNFGAAQYSANADSRKAFDDMKAAAENMRTAFSTYMSDKSVGNLNNFITAQKEYNAVAERSRAIITANGDAHKTFGGIVAGLGSKFSYLFSATRIMMAVYRTMKQMVKGAIELDSALTQLQIVTGESNAQMERFANTLAEAAQRVAVPIKDLIEAATVFARLGYSSGESATLAEFTAMLQNVGNIDAGDAQNAVTAIVKAYGIGVDEIETVMDKMVKVGNNFPISVSQIAEGMNNASSALAAAGNSFEESVALLTAANTTLQNASKASTGLRTLAARIRNTKAELDELGEEAITEAKYEEIVQMLTKYHVSLTDINGEYRSTYDIMKDIAAEWDKMTSMEQAALATQLAGTRQQTVFYSVINQFKEATGAMDAMADSAGTLSQAYDVYLDSTQAHINQFKAAFQQFGYNLFEGDVLRFFVDLGTGIVNALNKFDGFIDKLGGLKTVLQELLLIVAAFKFPNIIAFFVRISYGINTFTSSIKELGLSGAIVKRYGDSFTALATKIGIAKSALAGLIGVTLALAAAIALYNVAEQSAEKRTQARESQYSSNMEAASEKKGVYDLYNAYLDANEALDDSAESKAALKKATEDLAEALGYEGNAAELTKEKIKDLTDAELANAEFNARAAIVEAQALLSDMMNNHKNTNLQAYVSFSNAAQGFNWNTASEADKAQKLVEVYNELIEKRNNAIASGATEGAGYRSLTSAISQLEPYVQKLTDAEGVLSDITQYNTEVINGRKRQVDGLISDDQLPISANKLHVQSIEEMSAATQSAVQVQNRLGESFVQGTHMSKAMFDSIAALVGGEEALSAAVDKDRDYLIKNVDALNELIAASQDALANNIAYGKSFSQFRYHELTKQLYNLVGATDEYDEALRDEIDSTLNDLNNTRLQIEQYRLLEQQLLGVANGFERLNNAKAIDEAADYTDELSGAFDDLVNAFEKHEFGTETFQEAFKALVPENVYEQFEDLEKQYEAGWDYLTGTLSRYITKGDKGDTEVTFENVKNFLNDAFTMKGNGPFTAESTLENFTLDSEIKTLEQFADAMDVTTEVAFAMATAISKYMIGNEDFLENFEIESFEGKVLKADQELESLLAKKAQMEKSGNVTGPEWDELIDKIDKAYADLKLLQDQAKKKVEVAIELKNNDNLRDAYTDYLEEIQTANESSVDLSRMVYGNIDLANRQVIEWTQEAIDLYASELKSHGLSPDDLLGEVSTVLGSSREYDGVEIAFSPMLQTPHGAVLLSQSTVDKYIFGLIEKAGEGWTNEDLLRLDTEGLEVDGQVIHGLIADIGETAEKTAESMHFAGPDGSVALAYERVKQAAEDAGIAIEDLDDIASDPIVVQLAIDSIDDEIAALKQQLALAPDASTFQAIQSAIANLEIEKHEIMVTFGMEEEETVKGALEETIELQTKAGEDVRFKVIFENYSSVIGMLRDIINLQSQVGNINYTVSTGYAKATRSGRNQVMYTGTAHNSGNWGLPSSERDALLGELGAELVVDPRTGKYYTVGDHGAELVDLPKGAIIFNHKQTEELLKNGKIDTRGRALAEGNAHAGVGSATFNMKKFDYATAVAAAVGSAATSATASVAKEIAEEVKDVAEAVDELDDELKETLENMKKEMDEIIGNYEHSIFLLEKTGGSAESQIAIYEEMMKTVNDQANKYRGLGLDDNNDYIQDLQKQWWDYHDKIIDLNADMYDKIIDAHENSMSLREHWIEDAYARGDKAEAQRLQEEQIAEYEAVQRELHEKAEYYRSLGYKETDDEISELANKWWDYHDKINDIREDMFERMIQEHEDAVSVLENSVTLTENWLDNAESRGDRSGIIKYTNDIVNYYKEMQDEIHRQAEDYRSRGYSDLSDEVSALSDKWWEYQRNITDAMSSAFEQIVSEAHNSLDEIQGVYDTLIKASEEYAENGFITVDTFQEIAKMGVQYMSLLRNQNGELVISEQNINAIIAAKTRQLAVDTALDYVQKISTASKNNDITALKNLINATSLATTTTWDLVYAQLYAAGLSGDDYAAARRNIDNMRLLAENAVAGIGQVATTASNSTSSASSKANKALQEQKEALDDILKYVKEMIKQEIKDQVDALKEQQKAYKEIVDLQKKSLDLEKEKDSYTKDVKDKTNEIAKLQQKIYMLDLDNSREAQAEKAKLQEDLAKMQGDLADKQADKARDTTKDMLDDMAEAYSKEKDEEIKALEDSISSEEKLYRLAFTKVRINLLNCWKPLRAIYPTA